MIRAVYYNQIWNWKNAKELDLATGSKTGIAFNFCETVYAVTGTIAGIPDKRPVIITAWWRHHLYCHGWG